MQNRETDIVKTGTGSEFQVRTLVWPSRNSAFFTNSLGCYSFRFVVKTGSGVACYGARAPSTSRAESQLLADADVNNSQLFRSVLH